MLSLTSSWEGLCRELQPWAPSTQRRELGAGSGSQGKEWLELTAGRTFINLNLFPSRICMR